MKGLFNIPPELQEQAALLGAHAEQRSREVLDLLEQIAAQDSAGVQSISVTEIEVKGGVETDFPVPGGRRWLIPRLATGGSFEVPAELVTILEANNRRMGGTIVNRGGVDILLTLANPDTAASQSGLGQIFLKKEGGSWDFRLGPLLWCGSVCAKALEAGGSIATIVEV